MKFFTLFVFSTLFLAGCVELGSFQPPVLPNQTVSQENKSLLNKTPSLIIGSAQNTSVVNINGKTKQALNKSKVPSYTRTPDEKFAVYFINVGDEEIHGDAILIKKGDMEVLIDAGPARNSGKIIDFLRKKGVDDLEVLILTHADPEHYGGASAILNEFLVEEVWFPGKTYGDQNYEKIIENIKTKEISIKQVKQKDKFELNGLEFLILNPTADGYGDVDNDAIAMKISQNKFCLLLTSDILNGAQTQIFNNFDVRCDYLQLPFHGLGRGTAQMDVFILKALPKAAIVSGGSNDPSQDPKGTRFVVFEKLRLRGIPYYENYKNGTVRIVSDGTNSVIDSIG